MGENCSEVLWVGGGGMGGDGGGGVKQGYKILACDMKQTCVLSQATIQPSYCNLKHRYSLNINKLLMALFITR